MNNEHFIRNASSDTRITSMKAHPPAALAVFELPRGKQAAGLDTRLSGSSLGICMRVRLNTSRDVRYSFSIETSGLVRRDACFIHDP
jgi:hypothetical protein